ncbi:MAG: hypothetical protein AB7S68_35780 [Polyangiaceae bacterium]
MKPRLVRATVVGGLFALAAAAPLGACSDDDTKKGRVGDDAGTSDGSTNVGGSAGQAGTGGTAGMGASAGTGGTGASAGAGAAAGNGGAGATAGAGGIPADAGSDADAGPTFHGLYVSPTGSDSGTGERMDPFATFTHAASVALAGDTIVFLDGTHTAAQITTVPDGVDVIADNPGAATLSSTTLGKVVLAGTTKVSGMIFDGFSPALEATTGTLSVEDSNFAASASALDLSGNVVATLSASVTHVWGGGASFAYTHGSASLTVNGGIFENLAGSNVFRATETSTLNLSSVQITGGAAFPATISGSAKATLDTVAVFTKSPQLFLVQNQAELTITNSDLAMDPTSPSRLECIRSELNGVGAISLTDVKLHGCGTGINSQLPGTLTLLRTEIYANDFAGMDIGFGAGGTMDVADSNIHDNGTYGMRLGGAGGGIYAIQFRMRGTSISNATEGLRITGDISSEWDLGKVGDPGGNTIAGSTTGLFSLVPATEQVFAIGNNWLPNVQGADAQGHYSATGAGAVLDITGPGSTGLNYGVAYASSLRLAENP